MSEALLKASQLAGGIGNALLASDLPRPNLLQNGGFEQWHLGIGPFPADTGGQANSGADHWQAWLQASPAAAMTTQRETVNVDVGSGFSCACLVTASSGAFAGAAQLVQRFPDFAPMRGRPFTLQFRAKASVAANVQITWWDGITGGGAWQLGPVVTLGVAFQSLALSFTPAVNATSFVVSLAFLTVATYYVDNATMVQGSAAADYVPAISYPDALPNERLAVDVLRVNQLVNGGLEQWQRGAGPFTTNAVFFADRWTMVLAGTDTFSISKNTGAIRPGSKYSAACSFVLGTGAGGTLVYQRCAISDNPALLGQTISFKVSVNTDHPNSVHLYIGYDGTGANSVASENNKTTGVSEELTVTANIPADATYVHMGLVFIASCYCYMDNATCVIGNIPADFKPMHISEDLARCLRYYEFIGESNQSILLGGYNTAGNWSYWAMPYKARKTVAPTVTKNGTWTVSNCGQPALGGPGVDGCYLNVSATGTGAFSMWNQNVGNNITAEANP